MKYFLSEMVFYNYFLAKVNTGSFCPWTQ